MVMRPLPTSLFPSHAIAAPRPAGGPSKVFFAFGSSLAHGDQASHLRSSLTCGKTALGGAEIVADRVTRNCEGCIATTTRNTPITMASPIRILRNIGVFLWVEGGFMSQSF